MPSPSSLSPRPGRVDELDGLRGLLAFKVALAHMLAWSGYWGFRLPRPFGNLSASFIEASAAVETFVILSGFAISYLLHKRKQSYRGFMTGRVFRLYPVYLTCLVLGMTTTALVPYILETAQWKETIYFEWIRSLTNSGSVALGAHTFWHLTLLNGVLHKSMLANATGTLLVPAWSITLEWQYYLVAPLIERLFRTGTGLLILTIAAWFGAEYATQWRNPQLAFLPAYLPLFLVGIGSYHFYARYHQAAVNSPAPAIAVSSILAVAVLMKWHPVSLATWALVLGSIMARGTDPFSRALSVIRRILLLPTLQTLGKMSFPLYLVHWPIIVLVMYITLQNFPNITSAQNLCVLVFIAMPLTLVASRLLHCYIELPMMAFGKKDRSEKPAGMVTEL
jgi:peptidoglycan/LPS O-acetylase OafA/YrhL